MKLPKHLSIHLQFGVLFFGLAVRFRNISKQKFDTTMHFLDAVCHTSLQTIYTPSSVVSQQYDDQSRIC